jgi:hypothetical protein
MKRKSYYIPVSQLTPKELAKRRQEQRDKYQKHRDRIRKHNAAWNRNKYNTDPEFRAKRCAYQAKYRAAHRDIELKRKKEWQEKNKLARKVASGLGVTIAEARRQLGIENDRQAEA